MFQIIFDENVITLYLILIFWSVIVLHKLRRWIKSIKRKWVMKIWSLQEEKEHAVCETLLVDRNWLHLQRLT